MNPHSQVPVEVDHEEAEKSFGTPERADPKRHPYIVVKSPIHESDSKASPPGRQQ